MYAVIQSGGQQHRVVEGQTLRLEKLNVETGTTFEFDKILMVGEGEAIQVGTPFVLGSKVTAEVLSHRRGEKSRSLNSDVVNIHEAHGTSSVVTEVKITAINAES